MKKTTTFSAYWHVKNNPKLSVKLGHIKRAKNKNLDYFICSPEKKLNFTNNIYLNFDDLPSLPYLQGLKGFCKSRDFVFTKYGEKIKSFVFFNLATIWTSKILFFEKILEYTDNEYLMWIDCCSARNLELIDSSEGSKCFINQYRKSKFPSKPYGGLLKNKLPPKKILAQVVKIRSSIVKEFIKRYIECLQFTDNNFNIYDEEIVLTIMHQKYPKLFKVFR